jgi:GMP synthase (glutamine-hydrolysing)
MPNDILIIVHSEASTPGRVGAMLMERGFRLDIRRPCLGDALPESMDRHAAAVVFGGPMSANDPDDWIRREIDWIGVPLRENKPFLGICLGAQMLSKHLGGTVSPHPGGLVEIGYYRLRATEHGQEFDPWPEHVYHWHREGLTLPQDAIRLAASDAFENQAFRYNGNAFGIQFHPEVTRLTMHRWAVKGAHRFVMPNAQDAEAQLAANLIHDRPVKRWLSSFLDRWLAPPG